MYYLKGEIIEIQPNCVIVEANNIAYRINLSDSRSLTEGETKLIYTFQEFRLEVKNQISSNLYGFLTKQKIELFYFLTSIKGIGCKTAQVILSNDLYQLATLVVKKDSLSLARLKGLNWTLSNAVIYSVAQSNTIRNLLISLAQYESSGSQKDNNRKVCWDEGEVINSLIEIGYEWNSIKKALDELKMGNQNYPDNNSVINKCLQTIAQTQAI